MKKLMEISNNPFFCVLKDDSNRYELLNTESNMAIDITEAIVMYYETGALIKKLNSNGQEKYMFINNCGEKCLKLKKYESIGNGKFEKVFDKVEISVCDEGIETKVYDGKYLILHDIFDYDCYKSFTYNK